MAGCDGGSGLDPRTERLMRAVFGGRACCRCGRPAERLRRDAFYCHRHYVRPRRVRAAAGRLREHRVSAPPT